VFIWGNRRFLCFNREGDKEIQLSGFKNPGKAVVAGILYGGGPQFIKGGADTVKQIAGGRNKMSQYDL
jgi:hypothetical protein